MREREVRCSTRAQSKGGKEGYSYSFRRCISICMSRNPAFRYPLSDDDQLAPKSVVHCFSLYASIALGGNISGSSRTKGSDEKRS